MLFKALYNSASGLSAIQLQYNNVAFFIVWLKHFFSLSNLTLSRFVFNIPVMHSEVLLTPGTPARVGQVGRPPHLPRRWWGRKVPFWWRGEVHHTSVHGSMANSIRWCFEFGSWTRRPTCYHRLVQRMQMFVLTRSLIKYPHWAIISIRCQQQNWLPADTYKLLMHHTMPLYLATASCERSFSVMRRVMIHALFIM